MKFHSFLTTAAVSALTIPALLAQDYSVNDADAPARLRVTSEVINPGLEPFTATTGGSLGSMFLRKGGFSFEPVDFRNKFLAEADGEDSIVVDPVGLTQFNSYREGLYDEAHVMVFRVVNGRMVLVREDTVPVGGHKASGWNAQTRGDDLIAPDLTTFTGGFESWSRPNVPYWFALAAVDSMGRQGPLSDVVRIERPARPDGAKSTEQDKATAKLPKRKTKRGEPPVTGPADLPAPAGFTGAFDPALDQAVFKWDAGSNPDIVGYRLLRSDHDPARHGGYRIDLATKATSPDQHIKKGDMIIVQKSMMKTSRGMHLTNRIYDARGHEQFNPGGLTFHADEDPNLSWTLVPHEPGTPVEAAGKTAVRIDIRDNREFLINPYAYGPFTQEWWPRFDPTKDYVFEFWGKSEGGTKPATFELTGFYKPDGKNPVPPAKFELTDKWQKFSHTFRVPVRNDSHAKDIGQFKFAVQGPGVVFLDNMTLRQADIPVGALAPEDLEMHRNAKLGALRTHNFIKTFRDTYSMDQLTNPAGSNDKLYGNTLGQTLAIMEQIKTRPWLQIEFHMTPAEWLGFVEYMAAPYDPAKGDTPETKPWAAKRAAQGRTAPWTDAFDKVYFELSNETWNGLFAPWVFGNMPDATTKEDLDRGTVYGLFQEWVIDQLQKSPYWTPEVAKKFEFVIGGWASQRDAKGYGARAIAASPRSKHMTIAAYNGGWDEGEGPMTDTDASIQRILLHAPQVGENRSKDLAAFLASEKAAGRGNWVNGTYEAGPGYALSGLNNQAEMSPEEVETQNRAMKSLASGTATLDSFLEKAAHGFELGNYFTLSRGRSHWTSHTKTTEGGHPQLPFATIQLFNHEGTGDLLKVEPVSGPSINSPGFKRREAGNNLPLVTAYATRSGDRVNVFVLSRRLDKFPDAAHDGFTPVTLELPFKSAKKLTLHRLAGDPRAHNLDSEAVKIETVDLTAALPAASGPALEFPVNKTTGGGERGIPPGSTLLYVFEGVE